MYLTKDTITILADSTAASTPQYSNVLNGVIHEIVYRPTTDAATILSTTSTVVLDIEGTTDKHVFSGTIASTDMWRKYIREQPMDSTGALFGATTDYVPVMIPVVNERVKLSLALSTAEDLTGYLDIIVEGA